MNTADSVVGPAEPRFAPVPLRRRTRAASNVAESRALLVALAQEAHDASLLVATTGSIVNAVVSGKRPQLRTTMASYLPGLPLVYPTAVGTIAATGMPAQSIRSLSSFYGLITFARAATLGYSMKREPGTTCGPVNLETLSEAWQAAAMQAIGTLTTVGYLDKSSALNADGRDNSAVLRLVEMLWGVSLGRSPCVRIDGHIIIPGWVERRTHLRREINAPATLTVDGMTQHVTIRDISAGGIGVEGDTTVAPGDQVNVALGSGVCFEGIAMWNRDGRIGVRLSKPISSPVSED